MNTGCGGGSTDDESPFCGHCGANLVDQQTWATRKCPMCAERIKRQAKRANLRVAFKSWAAIWKLNIKKDNRINRLTTDPHAPCDFRGNLVNHMDEFYACFGVSPGDGMYVKPEDRLRMW